MSLSPLQRKLLAGLQDIPQDWSLTPVREKRPYHSGWQTEAFISRATLAQFIEAGDRRFSQKKQRYWIAWPEGYGIRTGSAAGGLLALDVDGPSAEALLQKLSAGDLPLTSAWTSGKPGRRQLLYQLPLSLQERLNSIGFTHYSDAAGCDADEALDFRYNRCQSVLPPSKHPQTGEYRWLVAPTDSPVAEAPAWLVDYLEAYCDHRAAEEAQRQQKAAEYQARRQEFKDSDLSAETVLQAINPDFLDWYQWRDCLLAAHHEGIAEDIVLAWSASSGKHSDRGFDDVWRHIKGRPGLTGGTLWHYATQQGWQPPQGKRRKKPKAKLSDEALTPDLVGEERYISDLMDQAKAQGLTRGKKLIVVRSPHNTGKTYWLKHGFFAKYQERHIPIWPLTYRQSLERAYGQLFGIPTRAESQQYRESIEITGETLCIHSMHPGSFARFDGETSPLGPISLDECRGVLQELVDSSHVKRGKVLPNFAAHLRRCIEAGYPIAALDAGVTNLEVNCLMKLLGLRRDQVLVVENTYQPWQGRQVYPLGEQAAGMLELKRQLRKAPGPIWITTSGQQPKSRYGSQTLETVCKSVNRKLKILRVDSETVHLQEHPAAKLMVLLEGDQEMVNEFLKLWDVVIVSPVVESGISVELFDHFRVQFSFVSGHLPAEAAVQQILRLRDTSVPIYLASPERGMDVCLKRGNGSPDLKTFRDGQLQQQKGNLHQLLVPSVEGSLDPCFTDYWLAIAARLNGSIPAYQDLLKHHLERVGCELCKWEGSDTKDDLKGQKRELAGVAVQQARERASEIAAAADLSEGEYETLKEARYKTPEQARALQRYELRSRYRGMEADETLARGDMEDRQLKPQVLLEFYLTIGRDSLKADEQKTLDEMAREGPTFAPDVNRRLIGHKIHCLELLGLADLIKRTGEQLTNQDEAIVAIGEALDRWQQSIKVTLGIELPKGKETIWKINHLVKSLLGWTLLAPVKTTGRRGEKRLKVYEVMTAATSPTFKAKEKDSGEDYPQLVSPPELLECRSRFLEHLACLHQPEPSCV